MDRVRPIPVVQTGSNFGVMVKHDNPFLVTVGEWNDGR